VTTENENRSAAWRSSAGSGRELKRGLILAAARKVFEAEGLDGASLRAIAAEAGYTPPALYFHFDSKEAIYARCCRSPLPA
jgi:AcrR family transcriptional regulator